MALNNPELLYVRRHATPIGMQNWLYLGHVAAIQDDTGNVRGYVEITGPSDGPTGNLTMLGLLLCVPVQIGPARELHDIEWKTIVTNFLAEEQYTDFWFVQQTSLDIIKAYRAGYDAAEKNKWQKVFNPMPGGDPDANLLHYAWERGYDRYVNMTLWQQQRDAWKNPQ